METEKSGCVTTTFCYCPTFFNFDFVLFFKVGYAFYLYLFFYVITYIVWFVKATDSDIREAMLTDVDFDLYKIIMFLFIWLIHDSNKYM